MYMKVIVFVIAVLSIYECSYGENSYEENDYQAHRNRVSIIKYPCAKPQPRVMYLDEILIDEDLEFYTNNVADIMPFSTVLHRCDATGCCQHFKKRCRANKTENVPLVFHLSNENINEFRTYTAVNHTLCSCQ